MRYFLLLLLTLIPFSTSFAEAENRCFNAIQNHVKEAIVHNKKVAPIYSELSHGSSTLLSWSLIATEEISIFLLKGMEKNAKFYQEKGIPLLCEEISDMKTLPVFQKQLRSELRPNKFFEYDQRKIRKQIKELTNNDQFDKAYQSIASDLIVLDNYPYQLCLTRHILESIARTLLLSPKHRAAAKKLDLPDPKEIIKDFITIQRRSLPLAYYLDKWAFSLQKEGLMIYCQDVPAVSWK
jgi:hypothetical protein